MSNRVHGLIVRVRRRFERLEGLGLWALSHSSTLLPPIAVAAVLWLTWDALRTVRVRDVRIALRGLEAFWIGAACVVTVLNVAVMGLYDVVAFRDTRSPALERWRYGAVAFAWSNFLTLGPIAGPAVRFWLYAPAIDRAADLHGGILATAIAFTSGLAGWTTAVVLVTGAHASLVSTAVAALAATLLIVIVAQRVARHAMDLQGDAITMHPIGMALVGWLDWLLAASAFLCVVRAASPAGVPISSLRPFFFGQIAGLASLAPGGFGSADAYWIARLPTAAATAAGIVAAFRLVYYVLPWAVASLILLSWATRRAERRIEIARRMIAGLVGGGGVLVMISSATPALRVRLLALEAVVPLPLVEVSQIASAMTGLLLIVLALKLARGYRAAFRATMGLLVLSAVSMILKGFDWEEAIVLGGLATAAAANASLFDRDSQFEWIEGPDVALSTLAVAAFVIVGVLFHRRGFDSFTQALNLGYLLEASRFARSAIALALAVAAAAVYTALRAPAAFRRPSVAEVDRALALHASIGGSSTPLMVANGDKAIFFDGDRGLCTYRIIGPYLVIFADPVAAPQDREAHLDALFRFAGEVDRRPLFYQLSPEWMPLLHDRGYIFFKLGEEGQLALDGVTLEGSSGKMYRQFLRRGEKDGVRFRIMPPSEAARRLDELENISNDWLTTKSVRERQFSIGFFDRDYLARFPCAVVEMADDGRVIAFANLLLGPKQEEFSVDLMRYLSGAPRVMDFLFTSLFFYAKAQGYRRFNLGMAPLASVGDVRGAHPRERLARLVFQHGEHWYNFQGLRFFKQKFDPEWQPRYISYQSALEFPIAIAYVSALIAGRWTEVLSAGPESIPTRPARADVEPAVGL